MLESYHSLSRIEDCFRVTKSQFEARPVFVWTEPRFDESIRV